MDFRFDDEQIALRDAIAALCRQHFSLEHLADREGRPTDSGAWRALTEMGVFGMLTSSDGEPTAGATYAAIAFEQLGAHLATGPALWSTIAAPVVPDAASGTTRVTGIERTAVAGQPFVIEHAAESAVVLIVHDDGVESLPASDLPDPLEGEPLDPLTPALACLELPAGTFIGGPEEAARLRRVGTILAAAELVGVAQGALDAASTYALERHQFDVPIGSFQAVKHLLADMYVRVELARSAMYAAAALFDDRHPDVVDAVSTAKLLAGEAGKMNGRTAVQIFGGMGFTWEMTPHYFLKRAWVLGESFGTGDMHALTLSGTLTAGARGR